MQRKIPFVMVGPSGVGKTTLAVRLLDSDKDLTKSVSWTTRKPRVGEENGQNYHFVSDDLFDEIVADGGFIEHATVYGEKYGTNLKSVLEALKTTDVLLVLDLQGAASLKKKLPETCIIYMVPPKIEELEKRLLRRKTEPDEVMKKRLSSAATEIKQGLEIANFVVVNDDLSKTLFDVISIIRACRIKNLDRRVIADRLGV